MKLKSQFGERTRVAVTFTQPSRTKQAHKDECDINRILARYKQTGVVEHLNRFQGDYGDLVAVDYQTAMNTVIEAQNAFNVLPASVRKRFANDPAEFLAFVSDPANKNEMVEMGLANRPADPVFVPPTTTKEEVPAGGQQLPT